MRNAKSLLWLPVGAMLATAGCTTMEKQIQSSGAMSPVDAEYVRTAYDLMQLDKAAAQLAATKASDPRVQDLATQIAAQADTLTPGLQAALHVEGANPPDHPSTDTAAAIAKLNSLSGPAFDRQFVASELALHQKAVPLFQREDTETKDGAMRVQVETEQPAVQANLDRLKALSDTLSPSQG